MWGPAALLAAIAITLWLAGPTAVAALCYDRAAIARGEVWRLLTGNFVHLGGWHLFFNLLSLALLVGLCPDRLKPIDWLGRIAWIGVGMSLGLYHLAPRIGTYVGLSGLIYGLFALGLGRQAARGDRIAWACLAFLAGRIGWELAVGIPASEERLIGGAVVAEAHLYGVMAALLYGAVFGVFRRPRFDDDNKT